jgi:hypothetical protein
VVDVPATTLVRIEPRRTLRWIVPLGLLLAANGMLRASTETGSSLPGMLRRAQQCLDPTFDVYAHTRAYAPFTHAFFAPFSFPNIWFASGLWCLAMVTLGFASVFLLVRAFWGDRDVPRGLWIITLVIAVPMIGNNVLRAQNNLLVLFLISLALWRLSLGRDKGAGAGLAFAAAFKLTPVIWLAYLLGMRRWRALASMVIWLAVFLLGVPALVFGAERSWSLQRDWYEGVIVAYATTGGEAVLTGNPYRHSNQSAKAVMTRVFTEFNSGERDDPLYVNVADLPKATIDRWAKLFAAAVLAVLVAATWRNRAALRERWSLQAIGLAGLVALAAPLVSEISWTSHYAVMLVTTIAVTGFALRAPPPIDTLCRRGLYAFFAVGLLSFHGPPKALGALFIANVLLFGVLAVAMWRLPAALRASPDRAPSARQEPAGTAAPPR